MKKRLLFGIHNHQPVGNFDHVFEHAYEASYKPFIDVLKDYPEFKFSMHNTGPLWEYFEKKHPELLDQISQMVERGQIELVISGFYEPVLASIPHRDRVGQIIKAIDYVKERFGVKPSGLWLTERVWESEILPSLIETGIKYVLVDDFHFISAGKKKEELHGYYLTECEGNTLAIFPIDETLRYLIPFREVEQGISYIKSIPGELAIIFDDGEKFGVWPGTYNWVYERGWLRKFVETVLSTPEIETMTYSEALRTFPPLGRIYLPTASYFEMGEWSLPAEGAVEFMEFVEKLRREGVFDKYRRFVRGGIWRNFLVKYEEANNMHKKMLYLSRYVEKRRDRKLRELLYRAQCNDAYWHGVFGGLYLPHLRKEIYRNLVELDARLHTPSKVYEDINKDGYKEISIKNEFFRISILPHLGGSIYEISHFPTLYNYQDTLTRRFEHYHQGVQIGDAPREGVASIHELGKWIDEKSAKEMVYDPYPRYSFYVHFIPVETPLESLRYSKFQELGDFVSGQFEVRNIKDGVKLVKKGIVQVGDKIGVEVIKVVRLKGSTIELEWQVHSEKPLNCLMAMELNLKFEVPVLHLNGELVQVAERDVMVEGKDSLLFEDQILKAQLELKTSHTHDFYVYPILTVSQSERGFDLVYQGNSIFVITKPEKRDCREKMKIVLKGGKNA
ncbi:MAG: alpha-amylase/4-alpha-glucanotransferase domain-containing protein [candidate division WOR-3 bacterium]